MGAAGLNQRPLACESARPQARLGVRSPAVCLWMCGDVAGYGHQHRLGSQAPSGRASPRSRGRLPKPAAGELRERHPGQRPSDHVGGIMHACMHARVGDGHGKCAQWDRGPRKHLSDPGGKRECSCAVPGGERARAGHPGAPRQRHTVDIRTPASGEDLEDCVDHHGGYRERGKAPGCRAAAGRPTGRRQHPGGSQRELRVVGGTRQPAEHAIERRGRGSRDRVVDREIEPLRIGEPCRPSAPGWDGDWRLVNRAHRKVIL